MSKLSLQGMGALLDPEGLKSIIQTNFRRVEDFINVYTRETDTALADIHTHETLEAWNLLVLDAGWANWGGSFNDLSYRKRENGLVEVKGFIYQPSGGTSIASAIFATLPVGYRPPKHYYFPAVHGSSHSIARLDVLTSGVLRLTGSAGTSWYSINALFSTD